MSRGGFSRGGGGARGRGFGGGACFSQAIVETVALTSVSGRGGGRGGFQQRDFGPPDTVLGGS